MKAVVTAPICPLKSRPTMESSLSDEALFGMIVDVLEESSSDFCHIRTHYRYEGYAPKNCLLFEPSAVARWEHLPKQVIWGKNTCDVMATPKVQSYPLVTLTMGGVVAVTRAPEADPETGRLSGWQAVLLPDGREGYVRTSYLGPYYDRPIDLSEVELRQRLCDTAKLYARSHYRWGGKSPLGIDCSGLVSMSYLLNGILIYRDAKMVEGFPIHPIDPANRKPADLLYFPGHIAMYLGDGLYIHSTGKAGSDGVVINSLNPDHPDYRADLPNELTAVGSYF